MAGDLEYFRLPKIDQATHALSARGLYSEVTFRPRMILVFSQARSNLRISIWTTFEPRSNLAYCAIFELDTFEPLDCSYSRICQVRQFSDCIGFNESGIGVLDTLKRPTLGLGLQ